jgi:hypothetical protein
MNRWLIPLALGLAAASPAHAFRCGTHLVSEGDTRGAVIAKCGEPTEVDHRSILRAPLVWLHGRPFRVGDALIEVPVELWTYNLGPNKLMQRVRFEDGLVVAIDTLGYGYRDSTPRAEAEP